MTEHEIQHFNYQLLKALDYSHSKGIMHRDLKPENIMFNRKDMTVRVIDWGLAEYYFPFKDHGNKVFTKQFKPPELLMGLQYYHYSADMWSMGVTLAS